VLHYQQKLPRLFFFKAAFLSDPQRYRNKLKVISVFLLNTFSVYVEIILLIPLYGQHFWLVSDSALRIFK
jgi:hypothetical protein